MHGLDGGDVRFVSRDRSPYFTKTFVGDNHRPGVSSTFIQPFLSWTGRSATTLGINTESTYNWKSKAWTIPVNMSISHLYNFGGQRVSLGGTVKVYAAREEGGPEWGARFIATFLFPR